MSIFKDFKYKTLRDFLCFQIALSWSIFELEKCSFFNRSNYARNWLFSYLWAIVVKMRIVPAKLVEFKGVVPLELIGAMCSPTVHCTLSIFPCQMRSIVFCRPKRQTDNLLFYPWMKMWSIPLCLCGPNWNMTLHYATHSEIVYWDPTRHFYKAWDLLPFFYSCNKHIQITKF